MLSTMRLDATFEAQLRRDIVDEEVTDVWRVYGDQLSERGDVRGQLIALEAQLVRLDDDDDDDDDDGGPLWQERQQLIAEHKSSWLGEAAASALVESKDQVYVSMTWRFGYLQKLRMSMTYNSRPEDLEALCAVLLDSDAARFLARFICQPTRGADLVHAVRVIAARARPFRALELMAHNRPAEEIAVGVEDCLALCAALPELRFLALHGDLSLATLQHDQLESLVLGGIDAIAGLGAPCSHPVSLPALHRLDMSVLAGGWGGRYGDRTVAPERLAGLLSDPGLGELRELDLSRNNKGSGPAPFLGGSESWVYRPPVLDAIAGLGLRSLRLPTPCAAEPGSGGLMGEAMVAALSRAAPQLADIEDVRIPRFYDHYAAFSSERMQRILPSLSIDDVMPHRPAAAVHGREVLDIGDAEGKSVWVGWKSLMELVEGYYGRLAPDHRATVDALVEAFEGIHYYDDDDEGLPLEAEVAREPLRAAMEAMGLTEEFAELLLSNRLLEMYRLLRDSTCERVSIEKVWGW